MVRRIAPLLILITLLSPRQLLAAAAVAMPDRYGAATASEILQAGGNAVDAAIAATFTLAVTYPEAGNIGGGGFMLALMDGEPAFLDFRERAPALAERDMYLDEGGNFVQRDAIIGGRASGVPGTVEGMIAAHERFGSLPWARLLQPAITLARDGFEVHPDLAGAAVETLAEIDGDTNFEAHFGALVSGGLFRQAQLARTLERLAEDPEDFYQGHIARQIVAQMARSKGLISAADLAAYQAVWRTPLTQRWRDYTVVSAPPPSSGGFALIQLLLMRDYADQHFRDLWHNSPRYIHLLAEIEKRVFADRAEYLGDPDFIDNPIQALIDPAYVRSRAEQVNPTAISPAESVLPGLEATETTHFSILDKDGNAVSLTYTLNWDFGSGVVVEGAGFLLNNEMDDFSAKVGAPNKFGVVGNANNAIAPGKRMLSSMTPTILLQAGKPALVVGTPGGSTIFTSVFQTILNIYDYGMAPQDAVNATRFHHQLPAATLIRHDQREIPAETRSALEKLGYEVQPNSWGDLGDVQVIQVEGDVIRAASDNRGRGSAVLLP